MKGPFGFFIHPLNYNDLYRVMPELITKRKDFIEGILKWIDPFVAAEVEIRTKKNDVVFGMFIVIPLLAKQFIEDEKLAVNKLIKGSNLAVKLGTKILGLGAFTSIVGRAGLTLVNLFKERLYFTSGASYTVASSLEVVDYNIKQLNLNKKELIVSVIGATGAIGKAISHLIYKDYKKIFLVARNKSRLNSLKNEILLNDPYFNKENIIVSTSISEATKVSDVVIIATSSPKELINVNDLKYNSIVCDISMPHNVSKEVIEKRKDVIVIEGGIIRLPSTPIFRKLFNNISFEDIIGYPKNNVLACMAETIILTAENINENYSIGRNIDSNKIIKIKHLADKHGFTVENSILTNIRNKS
jgi:fatty aldehyde-generating acyl-ACP reductase